MTSVDMSKIPNFLITLRSMLDHETQGIIRWRTDGRAFEILSKTNLEIFILPKYFRHNKFISLQRQLNYFGFKKQSKAGFCTYAQKYFSRDSMDQLHLIYRHKHLPPTTPRSICMNRSRLVGSSGPASHSSSTNHTDSPESSKERYKSSTTAVACVQPSYFQPPSSSISPRVKVTTNQSEQKIFAAAVGDSTDSKQEQPTVIMKAINLYSDIELEDPFFCQSSLNHPPKRNVSSVLMDQSDLLALVECYNA